MGPWGGHTVVGAGLERAAKERLKGIPRNAVSEKSGLAGERRQGWRRCRGRESVSEPRTYKKIAGKARDQTLCFMYIP